MNGGENDGMLVEWAPFRALPGVPDAAILEGSDALQRDFLAHRRGFVRRELLRRPDGEWVDVVYWEDQASADEAMKAAADSPVCAMYFHMMVPEDGQPGSGVVHLRRMRDYPPSTRS